MLAVLPKKRSATNHQHLGAVPPRYLTDLQNPTQTGDFHRNRVLWRLFSFPAHATGYRRRPPFAWGDPTVPLTSRVGAQHRAGGYGLRSLRRPRPPGGALTPPAGAQDAGAPWRRAAATHTHTPHTHTPPRRRQTAQQHRHRRGGTTTTRTDGRPPERVVAGPPCQGSRCFRRRQRKVREPQQMACTQNLPREK